MTEGCDAVDFGICANTLSNFLVAQHSDAVMKVLKIQIQLLQKKQVSFPDSNSLLVNVSVANEQKSLHQHYQQRPLMQDTRPSVGKMKEP